MAGINGSREAQIAALLNMFEYLDYHQGTPGQDMRTLVEEAENFLKSNPDRWSESKGNMIEILKEGLDTIPGFADLRLSISEHGNAIEADAFISSDGQEGYVAYRGTGDGKWIDNGRGMTEEITASQQAASDFYDRFVEQNGLGEDTNLIVTGHSKGGNNAQAATLNSENRSLIDKCISFDGQGFSDDAIERYSNMPGYEDQRNKMYGIHGENDPVNELGITVIPDENTVFIETNADSDNLVATHALEYLFHKGDESYSCTMNGTTQQGPLGKYLEKLSSIIMSMPEDTRGPMAVALMQFIEFTEEQKVGFGGDHATFSDMAVFMDEGLPLIISTLIGTEEGREAIMDILRDYVENCLDKGESPWAIAARVLMTTLLATVVLRVAIPIAYTVINVLAAFEQLAGILEQIGEFIQECFEAVAEFFEEIGDWIRSKVTGRPIIKEGDFSVDIGALRYAADELGTMQGRLSQAASKVNSVRGSLPMYGIAASAAKAYLSYITLCIYQVSGHTGTMRQAVDNISGTYEKYECRIAENAPA